MAGLSHSSRRWLQGIFAAVFLGVSLVGVVRELRAVQARVESVAAQLAADMAARKERKDSSGEGLGSLLEGHRVRMKAERIELFDAAGNLLAESPPNSHDLIVNGVLASSRAGVRDPASGREIAQLVVWRSIDGAALQSILAGAVAALLVAAVSWRFLPRERGREEGAAG